MNDSKPPFKIDDNAPLKVLAVTNIYPTPADPSQGTFVEQQICGLRMAGVEVEVLHFDLRGRGMSAYRGIGSSVRQAEARFEPHVVHAMYGGMLGHQTMRATRRPAVVSFCGSDLLGDGGAGWVRRNVFSRYRLWASHRAARMASAIVVKSENLRAALPEGIDRRKVITLPNGIDLSRFESLDRHSCQSELGIDPQKFQILFADSKGQPRKRRPLAEAAVEELRRFGIPAELQVIQKTPHEQVPKWINAADVLLLTSIHEGSPNVVKETLACDVPVVSVDVGDVKERLAGISGCYLCEAEPAALAAALRKVYEGQRRVEGRGRMLELTTARVAERLIELYRSVALQVAPVKQRRSFHGGVVEGRS